MIATKRLFAEIKKSIEDQSLDTLNAYLSSTDISEAFHERTLIYLGNLLEKCEDDKLMPADLILSCLQHFVDKKISPVKWQLVSKRVGQLCEIVFNISATNIKDAQLVRKNVRVFKAILRQDWKSVLANSMLQFTMHTLLTVALDDLYSHAVRMELLMLISSIMSKSKREHRQEIIPTKTSYLDNLSNALPTCGDYEMQVVIVEILARSWNCLKKEVNTNTALFTKFPNVMDVFKKHNFRNLDTECRLFLKVVNSAMGDNQLVFSIPCVAVMIDQLLYKKPFAPNYKEFWVDFNVGTKSVSFYFQTSPKGLWDMKTIYGDSTDSAKSVISTRRSWSGEVITTIKLEIIFREKKENSEESKSLEIYARKCKEFEKLEEKALKEIFQDKYESVVTFEELLSPPDAPAKKQPDSNESKHEEEHSPAANNSSYISKETYARPKGSCLGKRKKTVVDQILISSDSDDLDFIRPKIKPPTFEVSDHVMEVDTPREIEVGPPVEPVNDDIPKKGTERKKGGAAKKNAPKKENKVPEVETRNVQTRKPRAKKVLDCSEKLVENELTVQTACTTTCTENDKSKGNEESGDYYLAIDVQNPQLIKNSESPEPASANLVYMRKCLSEAGIRVRNVLTHAQNEREIYCSTFSFKTHSLVSVLQDQIKKLVVINNNLLQVKALLDSTTELQNEVYLEIEKEVNELEETKHSFLKNLSNVEETQSSKIVSMFQELGKFLKNFALSLFQGNATKE